MGVTVQSVSPSLQQQDHLTPAAGALVSSVQAGSPADQAGLKTNDVVVSLNGTPISTATALTAALHPLKPGDVVKVGIYRGSAQQTVSVTLGTNPAAG
jgi:S1-C subfamily serine protease